MSKTSDEIIVLLKDDLVSHGWLAQCLSRADAGASSLQKRVAEVLDELLSTGNVEIGLAKVKTHNYVEFIAWNGSVDERIARATEAVVAASGPDQEFAYWLCLRENVDRFEGRDD